MSDRMAVKVLEYDIRDPRGTLPQTERTRFLLAPAVQRPLSVDTLVWPSVLDPPRRVTSPTVDILRSGIGWTAPRSVAEAIDRVRAGGERLDGEWDVVAIAIALEQAALESPSAAAMISRGTQLDDGIPWVERGWDVADSGLISGLSNCGYSPEALATLAPIWAPRVNQDGLFADVRDALAFRDITDRRVPEHAPFFIFALMTTSLRALIGDESLDRGDLA